MLSGIQGRCEGVEFVGGTEVEAAARTVANVKRDKQNLDGILYFGALPRGLTELGLPTIAVHPLWGQWQYPFTSYAGQRVLTACLPVIPDASASVFSSRLETLAEKVRVLQAVARMKGLKVLIVTDKPTLGEYEPTALQIEAEGWEGYERRYLENMAELGPEVVARPQSEMVSKMQTVDEAAASDVARAWIAGAAGIRGTNETEIQQSARLYLTMSAMLEEYSADAITTEGYGVFMRYKDGPIPSQGMPSSQFCTDGIVATSETLVDSLVTQQLGLFVTGSTGFNGDYVIDPENNKAYIGHCECPFNPYGDARRVPYAIRNLPQWGMDEQDKGGACAQVFLPAGETVTVAKISVHDKKLSLFTGQTVDGEKLFVGWYDILCRTKLAIEADAQRLLDNLDWRTFGNHRVAFYGDHRQRFEDLATLLGYDTVSKDA
jgi:L-fucose isomerase-like protein